MMKKCLMLVLVVCLLASSIPVMAERALTQPSQVNEFISFGEYDSTAGALIYNLTGSKGKVIGWNDDFITGIPDLASTEPWISYTRDKYNSYLNLGTSDAVYNKKFDEMTLGGSKIHISFDMQMSGKDNISIRVLRNKDGNNVNVPTMNGYVDLLEVFNARGKTRYSTSNDIIRIKDEGGAYIDTEITDANWHKYEIQLSSSDTGAVNRNGRVTWKVFIDGVQVSDGSTPKTFNANWNGNGLKGIQIKAYNDTNEYGSKIDNLYVRHYNAGDENTETINGILYDKPAMAIEHGSRAALYPWATQDNGESASYISFSELLVDESGNPYTPVSGDFEITPLNAPTLSKTAFDTITEDTSGTGFKVTKTLCGDDYNTVRYYKVMFINENIKGKSTGAKVAGATCIMMSRPYGTNTWMTFEEKFPTYGYEANKVTVDDSRIYEYYPTQSVTANGATKDAAAGNYPIITKNLSTYAENMSKLSFKVKGVNSTAEDKNIMVIFAKYKNNGLSEVSTVPFTAAANAKFEQVIYDNNHAGKPQDAKTVDFDKFGEDMYIYIWNGDTIEPYTDIIDYTTATN